MPVRPKAAVGRTKSKRKIRKAIAKLFPNAMTVLPLFFLMYDSNTFKPNSHLCFFFYISASFHLFSHIYVKNYVNKAIYVKDYVSSYVRHKSLRSLSYEQKYCL